MKHLTEHSKAESESCSDAGFTLIELMVVLLIIAILLAIAIPTFLGVTSTAGDRAAQSNLTNALTESKALYEVSQTYSPTAGTYTAGQFSSQAPEFSWTTSACTSASAGNCVSFGVFNVSTAGDGQGVALAAWSAKTNTCWYLFDVENSPSSSVLHSGVTIASAGTWYGKQTSPSGGCIALNPDTDATTTPGMTFATGTGQSYATAVKIS
jgi:type IV pilus assembly protein PilA